MDTQRTALEQEEIGHLMAQGRVAEVQERLESALEQCRAKHGGSSPEVVTAHHRLGAFFLSIGDTSRAVSHLGEAHQIDPGGDKEREKLRITLLNELGGALEKDGQIILAERAHLEALELRAVFYGRAHAGYGFGLAWYAEFLARRGDERASKVAMEAFDILQRDMHPKMTEMLVLMARIQIARGVESPFSTMFLDDEELWNQVARSMADSRGFPPDIVLRTAEAFLLIRPAQLGLQAPGRRTAHEIAFGTARASGDHGAMLRHADALREWLRREGDLRGEQWATMEMSFACEKLGDLIEAEALLKEGIRLANQLDDGRPRSHALRQLGTFLAHQRRPEAEQVLSSALLEALSIDDPLEIGQARVALGLHLQHQGRLEDARSMLAEAVASLDPALPAARSARCHLDAIERGGGCGCGDQDRALQGTLEALLRSLLPEGLLEGVVVEDGHPALQLTREPSEEEQGLLERAWTEAMTRLQQPELMMRRDNRGTPESMFWDWFRKDPVKALQGAIVELEQLVAQGAPPGPTSKALQRLAKAASAVDEGPRSEALARLAKVAAGAPLAPSSGALFGIGILIETGADPRPASQVILARGKEAFVRAARHTRLVDQAFDEAEQRAGRRLSDEEAMRVIENLKTDPQDEAVGNLIEPFSQALIALLSRSKSARKSLNEDEEFRGALALFARFTDRPSGGASKFAGLLDDEELLVIHPASRQGVRVKIAGITHNFQLHTLLADALVPDFVPGQRPDPVVAAEARSRVVPRDQLPVASACFHLMHFGAVLPDGTIDEDPFKAVIWHEGTPADIPALEGARVVLLGEPRLPRSWKAPRDFEAMEGELAVTSRLTQVEVEDWLRRMASAPRPPDLRPPPGPG